jgi:hypothetical protein
MPRDVLTERFEHFWRCLRDPGHQPALGVDVTP